MTTAAILSFIQLAIASAPGVVKIVEDGKKLIDGLFADGAITADVQNEQKAWADAHMAASLNGTTPPEFTVQA